MKKSHDNSDQKHDPGRRRFLKGVGIASVGAALFNPLLSVSFVSDADKRRRQSLG
jgi:hypothetical protein